MKRTHETYENDLSDRILLKILFTLSLWLSLSGALAVGILLYALHAVHMYCIRVYRVSARLLLFRLLLLLFLQTLRSDENRFSQSVTFDTQRMEDGSRGTLLL